MLYEVITEQVASFLSRYLKIDAEPKYLDATDGVAAALCHFFQNQNLKKEKSVKSWNEFISKNPGRVKK